MHVPRAYMPVMLAKGPAPFTARSVALRGANSLTVRTTVSESVTTRNKLYLLGTRVSTVLSLLCFGKFCKTNRLNLSGRNGTGIVPLRQSVRSDLQRSLSS